jgi:hypothetical protein
VWVLLAAVITVVLSGIVLMSFKRHLDRQGVASAIGGEIYSILHMEEKRQTAHYFASLLPRLHAGEHLTYPDLTGGASDPQKLPPIFEKNIDKVGLLPENLPERVVTFHTYLRGIQVDTWNLVKGTFPEPAAQANVIQADLALWGDAQQLGASIGVELRRLATTKWWPAAIWDRAKVTGLATLRRIVFLRTPHTAAPPPQTTASMEQGHAGQVPNGVNPFYTTSYVATPYQELANKTAKLVNAQLLDLMTRLGSSKEDALRYLTIDYLAALTLERASRYMFGSQIDALEFLVNNNQRATLDEVRRFCSNAAAASPEVYDLYPFEGWLDFLKNRALLQVQDDFVELLPAGKAIVPYLRERGYLENKPGY